jgi:hypothetical protein
MSREVWDSRMHASGRWCVPRQPFRLGIVKKFNSLNKALESSDMDGPPMTTGTPHPDWPMVCGSRFGYSGTSGPALLALLWFQKLPVKCRDGAM